MWWAGQRPCLLEVRDGTRCSQGSGIRCWGSRAVETGSWPGALLNLGKEGRWKGTLPISLLPCSLSLESDVS